MVDEKHDELHHRLLVAPSADVDFRSGQIQAALSEGNHQGQSFRNFGTTEHTTVFGTTERPHQADIMDTPEKVELVEKALALGSPASEQGLWLLS